MFSFMASLARLRFLPSSFLATLHSVRTSPGKEMMKVGNRERTACSAACIAAAMLSRRDSRISNARLGTSSHIPFVNVSMGGLST